MGAGFFPGIPECGNHRIISAKAAERYISVLLFSRVLSDIRKSFEKGKHHENL
jgi:hypothetical protein